MRASPAKPWNTLWNIAVQVPLKRPLAKSSASLQAASLRLLLPPGGSFHRTIHLRRKATRVQASAGDQVILVESTQERSLLRTLRVLGGGHACQTEILEKLPRLRSRCQE